MEQDYDGDSILEKLKDAGRTMSADDVRKQKISFIKGTLDPKVKVTDEQIEAEIDRFPATTPIRG